MLFLLFQSKRSTHQKSHVFKMQSSCFVFDTLVSIQGNIDPLDERMCGLLSGLTYAIFVRFIRCIHIHFAVVFSLAFYTLTSPRM